jgi:alpha-1,2-mannosyltransferase
LRRVARFRRDLWALLTAFGIYGLIVWPVTAWYGPNLVAKELSTLHGLKVNASTAIGRDFVNIWHGGGEAARHGAKAVYDREAYRATLKEAVDVKGIYAFSYPPHMLILAAPFGLLSYPAALAVWTLGGLAFFWIAARPWLHEVGLPSWSVLLLPGTIINLWAGHFGFLIGGLALLGFWHADRAPTRSAMAFALMTVKPHLGLLVPVVLLAKQRLRLIWLTCVGTLGLILVSVAALGKDAWAAWFSSTLAFQLSLTSQTEGAEFIQMMPTIKRALTSINAAPALVTWVPVVVALVAVAVLLLVLKRGASVRQSGLASQVATFLILPYAFHYDLVILSLIALLTARRWKSRWFMPDKLICGAAFVVPLVQVPLAKLGWWPSPIVVGALFLLLCWRLTSDPLEGRNG